MNETALHVLFSVCQQLPQVVPVEDVVAKHKGAGRAIQKLFTDDEGLRQPVRAGLHGVFNADSPLAAVAQKLLKARRVLRRADEQNFAYAREHEGGERVIHHRLVVDGQQLLADGECGRVQARARTARQNDAFALGHGVVAEESISVPRARW